ncbi:MAG: N-acetyl-gamma-glutamyl-phosphate reductase [Oscillospiraceae bacterium]|nr:N-acetyl-gamma-glutamyl-phosphate reductase [Oscillospiraceae bacterium]MCR5807479.1 N-acetyl-gamma-glutamyl-phosphate reductase [Oscillospiraceae bacterium]
MKTKIFIDGKEGTTGLRITERLSGRDDIELLTISEELRKDVDERRRLINESDYTFLCLPDAAAIEAVSLVENENTKIIDASTAHRTAKGWTYGLPELSEEQREAIARSKRVSVPGCYASGFNVLMYPMVKSGYLPAYHPIICHAVSGYSGGGKKLIAAYEDENRDSRYDGSRAYSLGKTHKHVKEMMAVSGLSYPPVFCPSTADFYNGMVVTIPVILRTMSKKGTPQDLAEMFAKHYEGQRFVRVMPFGGEGTDAETELYSNALADKDYLQIFVYGNEDHALLVSRFDNLGKGASGAAIQCFNIMCGLDEGTGLVE